MVRCTFCGKPGHVATQCWHRQKAERERRQVESVLDQIGEDSDSGFNHQWSRAKETMNFLILQAPEKEHEHHDRWCYHVQGMLDLWEDVHQIFIFEESLFRPAAERFGMGLHPPKPVVNSVTTLTAQLPDTSDAATDPPPTPPARTYAEAATQVGEAPKTYAEIAVQAAQPGRKQEQGGEGKEKTRPPPASPGKSGVENRRPREQRTPPTQRARRPPTTPETPLRPPGRTRPSPAVPTTKGSQPATRALVMHAAPLK